MKKPRTTIAQHTPPPVKPRCTDSTVALHFWSAWTKTQPAFNPAVENLTALVLDSERRIVGAHPVKSKSFGDAQRFADELFQAPYLRGVPEFLLVQSRPSAAVRASDADKARVRAIILAGRARRTELLDCLICGKPEAVPFGGVFSFHHLKAFSAVDPFAKSPKKARQIKTELEAAR